MANPNEIESVMRVLLSAYPKTSLSRDTVLEYAFVLEDIPGDVLYRAVQECIRSLYWFPKISDLYKHALKIAGVRSFYLPPEFSYRTLLAEQVELQASYAGGEPLDESAWLTLANKYHAGGYYQAHEHTLKRLASYKTPLEEK